jgi:hypothetical protein
MKFFGGSLQDFFRVVPDRMTEHTGSIHLNESHGYSIALDAAPFL